MHMKNLKLAKDGQSSKSGSQALILECFEYAAWVKIVKVKLEGTEGKPTIPGSLF